LQVYSCHALMFQNLFSFYFWSSSSFFFFISSA
jgi:hypothetical protein